MAFRRKLFLFKSNLDQQKWNYVQLYDIHNRQDGGGYDAQYMDSGNELTVTSGIVNGTREIKGNFQCNFEWQDYSVVLREIATNRTPVSIFVGVQNTTFDGFVELK